MPQKKVNNTSRLKNTLNELDTALDQWNSLTSKAAEEQAPEESELQKKAKKLLKELRDQLDDFSED